MSKDGAHSQKRPWHGLSSRSHLCPEMNPVVKFTNFTIFRYAHAKITNFTNFTFFSCGDAKIAEFTNLTIFTIFCYCALQILQIFFSLCYVNYNTSAKQPCRFYKFNDFSLLWFANFTIFFSLCYVNYNTSEDTHNDLPAFREEVCTLLSLSIFSLLISALQTSQACHNSSKACNYL